MIQLPEFMAEDATSRAFAAVFDSLFDRLITCAPRVNRYHAPDLSEKSCDELASEMGVSWYRKDASLSEKRNVIQNAGRVFGRTGTKSAVLRLIRSYAGEEGGAVEEWFEYAGTPGHYRVSTAGTSIASWFEEFKTELAKITRASAVLDSVAQVIGLDMIVNVGGALALDLGKDDFSAEV